MKKYFFMAVAGMLALSSCSNDNDEIVNENTPHKMTFIAGYSDGADTRATMNFNGDKKVSFDANDQISILSTKNANAPFTTTAGGASAEFTGEAADDSKFYAVYPYTAGLTLDGTTIKGVTIPTTQTNSIWNNVSSTGEDYNWDPKAPIALAVAEPGNALQFKNLCAILKVKLEEGGPNPSYKVKVSASEPLAGTFDLNTETYALTATSGSTSVTAQNTKADLIAFIGARMAPRNIYIAIAPGTYTNFKVKAECDDDNFSVTKTKTGSVTFEKGKVYDLGTFESDM